MSDKTETTVTAKTVEEAVAAGADALGRDPEGVSYEVLEEPRKGILGIGAAEAKVRVYIDDTPAMTAALFVKTLLDNMKLGGTVTIEKEDEEGALISVSGDNMGLLIGRHGDVLDSLQYLTTLATNKKLGKFYRITLDIENYRQKRIKTLRSLAARMSEKVLKYNKSFSLEPMNAYERRIIHSECQKIQGITTYSVGDGNERRIIIAPEGKGRAKK